jgi:hypothetical protein
MAAPLFVHGIYNYRAFFINNGRPFRRLPKQRLDEINLLLCQVLPVHYHILDIIAREHRWIEACRIYGYITRLRSLNMVK